MAGIPGRRAGRVSAIVLLDTSVYLNILDVPSFNQDREGILAEFRRKIEREDHFLLPMAAIWETGNHIAGLGNGGLRYRFGQRLVRDVRRAIQGETPYRPTYFPDREEFLEWLNEFPQSTFSEAKARGKCGRASASAICPSSKNGREPGLSTP